MTTSLFHYPEGKDFNTYNILDFTPLFYEKVIADMTPTQLTQAKDTCGDNRDCIFDLAVTGRCTCMASVAHMFTCISILIQNGTNQFSSTVNQNQSRHLYAT